MDIVVIIAIILASAALTGIVALLVLRAVKYFKRRNQPLYLNPDELTDAIMEDIEADITEEGFIRELQKEVGDDIDRWNDEGGQ